MEIDTGFNEARGKQKFFNLGEKNRWQKILPLNVKENIEKIFYEEMKELKYLD